MVDKNIGETPLEALERFRADHTEYADIPMTYAGRLDPMAEGKLLILIGDECKNKEKYLGLDKEYEVEILFGVDTDTHDVLGRVLKVNVGGCRSESQSGAAMYGINLQKYVGKFEQEYPAYSSKTVGGKALHIHARAGTLSNGSNGLDWPKKSVEIYSIHILDTCTRFGSAIAGQAIDKIGKLHEKTAGDFRKKEIMQDWRDFGKKCSETTFFTVKIRVACSSGTYMRSLAKRIGDDVGQGAIAFSIRRTKIGDYA